MDPLAHTLVGATLARTRLGRDRPLAMPTLLLAANVADVDAAAYFWSSDTALAFRRGLTHGPIGLAVLPALVAVAVWLYGRRRVESGPDRTRQGSTPFSSLLALAYLAAFTHPALDWLNTYGVRLLYPFDRRWFAGDTLFIVDPWVWLLLGAGMVLGRRAGRRALAGWAVVAAIAAALLLSAADSRAAELLWLAGLVAVVTMVATDRPRTETGRRRLATACLAGFAIYLALAIGLAAAARGLVHAAIAEPSEALMVGPLPLTLARREVVVETATEIRRGRFRWLGSPRFEWSDWSHPRPEPSPALTAAMQDPSIQGFLGWARFPFVEIDEHPDSWEVHLMDARYTVDPDAVFGSVTVRVPRR